MLPSRLRQRTNHRPRLVGDRRRVGFGGGRRIVTLLRATAVAVAALGCADQPTGADGNGEPLAVVDVVVIGSGAAGLAAAWEVEAAGGTVVLLEREGIAGGSARYASRMWAAGTTWQAAFHIDDSPELALSEWTSFTGGDPEDSWVRRFVFESAETLQWLVGVGDAFTAVSLDPETGSVPRMHENGGGSVAAARLAEALVDVTWLSTEATGLVEDRGRVVGVEVHDLETDRVGWVQGRAVVVATGGFVRDDERLLAAYPTLAVTGWVNESMPWADGNGLDLIEGVGGRVAPADVAGIYGHSVRDPQGDGVAALFVTGLGASVLVDATGRRVVNEDYTRTFGAGRAIVEHGSLHAIVDDVTFDKMTFSPTPFDWGSAEGPPPAPLDAAGYLAVADVPAAETPAALGDRLGIDGEVLAETVDAYNDAVRRRVDEAFGKDLSRASELTAPPFRALAIQAGPAKSYRGARLGPNAEVLDEAGEVVPGLFAAGEVAGVLGTEAIGWGFSGSLSACWFSGRVAGQGAVVAAQVRSPTARSPSPR